MSYFNTILLIFLMCHGHVNCLQPLFPGESGVDQLVEIIKVRMTFCLLDLLLFFLFLLSDFYFFPSTWIRYWEHQPERKSSAWTQTIQNSNFPRLKHTHGIRSLAFSSKFIVISVDLFLFLLVLLWGWNSHWSCNLQIFHMRMPAEAIDLVSRLLQYSPNLRCTAVRIFTYLNVTLFLWNCKYCIPFNWCLWQFLVSFNHIHAT